MHRSKHGDKRDVLRLIGATPRWPSAAEAAILLCGYWHDWKSCPSRLCCFVDGDFFLPNPANAPRRRTGVSDPHHRPRSSAIGCAHCPRGWRSMSGWSGRGLPILSASSLQARLSRPVRLTSFHSARSGQALPAFCAGGWALATNTTPDRAFVFATDLHGFS